MSESAAIVSGVNVVYVELALPLWSNPKIQAVPSLQPVSLLKFVKTNAASFLSEVARMVTLITMTARMDQYTVDYQFDVSSNSLNKHFEHTSEIIPFGQNPITIKIGDGCEE